MKCTEKVKQYPVTWVQGKFIREVKSNKPIGKNTLLGFCGKTTKVFRICRNILEMVMINNIYVSNNKCEFAKTCLCFSCEHNKADKEIMRLYFGLKSKTSKTYKWFSKMFDDKREFANGQTFEGIFGEEIKAGIMTKQKV